MSHDHLEIQGFIFSQGGEFIGSATGREIDEQDNFILFVTQLRSLRLLAKSNATTTVVYADDQFVNREAMRMNFEDMDLSCNLMLF